MWIHNINEFEPAVHRAGYLCGLPEGRFFFYPAQLCGFPASSLPLMAGDGILSEIALAPDFPLSSNRDV